MPSATIAQIVESFSKTIDEPTLIISAECGLLSLADKEIDMIDLSIDDNGNLIPKEKRIERLKQVYSYLLTEEARKYKWVFIDSLSEIAQNLMESLYLEFPDRKDSLPMYGENSKRMRSIIKSFRDLPGYNVVMTCLSEIDKDENNQRFIGVQMVGKISQVIPAFFDEVFYLHVAKQEDGSYQRSLITGRTEKLIAKDRSGKLEQYEKPNLQIIANKIRSQNV
jgi:hypothetical protein